jgi:hypothetical protein
VIVKARFVPRNCSVLVQAFLSDNPSNRKEETIKNSKTNASIRKISGAAKPLNLGRLKIGLLLVSDNLAFPSNFLLVFASLYFKTNT